MTRTSVASKKGKLGYSPLARVLLLVFFSSLAILIMIPLLAMLLGTFKGGA